MRKVIGKLLRAIGGRRTCRNLLPKNWSHIYKAYERSQVATKKAQKSVRPSSALQRLTLRLFVTVTRPRNDACHAHVILDMLTERHSSARNLRLREPRCFWIHRPRCCGCWQTASTLLWCATTPVYQTLNRLTKFTVIFNCLFLIINCCFIVRLPTCAWFGLINVCRKNHTRSIHGKPGYAKFTMMLWTSHPLYFSEGD